MRRKRRDLETAEEEGEDLEDLLRREDWKSSEGPPEEGGAVKDFLRR